MKVFFCHAGEDKPIVEQVFQRVIATFPDVEGWLDKYEVVAGQDLIDKIAEGIESSERFFIFLSDQSVDKPWVKTELRKALMEEISGIKADFIVPVKVGPVAKFPAFIESKKYIDLEHLTEAEWLREIEAVIRGAPVDTAPGHQTNLQVWQEGTVDDPGAIAIIFQARYWAEPVGFKIETRAPISERHYRLLDAALGSHSFQTIEDEQVYAVRLPDKQLKGGQRFAMLMKFGSGTEISRVVSNVEPWDGTGSQTDGMAF